MQFVDYVTIIASSGHGGRGCLSFRREKYIPFGGPNGGDGGKGGDVVFIVDKQLNTLLDYKYNRIYNARNGGHGMGKDCHGQNGEDIKISVPAGTIIKNKDTGEVLADLTSEFDTYIAARGGRGGKGNAHFKSSTHRTPRFCQPGEPGVEVNLILELKLMADVGLIGLPNAGKSTLIATISEARPKIADYPFTTLVPNLGVVKSPDYTSFVIADIPGIIKDAHLGAGLGVRFLRHAERTKMLLHLIDVSDMSDIDPITSFETVCKELDDYSSELSKKELAIVATKIDAASNQENLIILKEFALSRDIPFFQISSAAHIGIMELLIYLAKRVKEIKQTQLSSLSVEDSLEKVNS
ncbi:MAG: GTPase ObgE [Nitrospirae bacterium]|nr:GTPase ObgE [Nitrospirota bacterium]